MLSIALKRERKYLQLDKNTFLELLICHETHKEYSQIYFMKIVYQKMHEIMPKK